MKQYLNLFFIFILSSTLGFAQDSLNKETEIDEIERFLLEVKKEFAPDARTVYFQYTKNENGSYELETSSTQAQEFIQKAQKESADTFPIEIKVLPDASLNGKQFGVINLSVANLRTKPSHSAELATQALLGTPVDILKTRGGFYLIRTPDHYLSWVDRYGLAIMNKQEMDEWHQSKRKIFIKDFGHAFQDANEQSPRVSDVILGDILKEGKQVKGFQEVFFPDGRRAFVLANQVEDFDKWKIKTKPEADKIIETAKTMLGVPYLWGGTSVKGVDCSGFTKTSYFMNGLVLPRDASQQIKTGLALDIMTDGNIDVEKAKKNLKKGDLIFFSASKNTNPKLPITHVAIYIENGEFIHAAGRVRINSFDPNDSLYDSQSETIVAAHRYLGNVGINPIPSISSLSVY